VGVVKLLKTDADMPESLIGLVQLEGKCHFRCGLERHLVRGDFGWKDFGNGEGNLFSSWLFWEDSC